MFSTRYLFLSAGILLFLLGDAAAQNLPSVPARDFQQWTQIGVNYDLAPKFTITSFAESRAGNNVSQFAEELLSAAITYSPGRFASFGGGYIYFHENPYLTSSDYENRLYTEATFKTPKSHGFVISDRVRSELRWIQVADKLDNEFIVPGPGQGIFAQRYRNRVSVEHPIRVLQTKGVGFVRWERFFDTLSHGWTRTRYYAGFDMPINHQLTTETYYLYQRDTAFAPHVRQTVGITFTFDFHKQREAHSQQ
jgi:hypothetical protein